LGAALYNPVWTTSARPPADFAIVLVGLVLLTAWRAPPLLIVAVSALGGMGLVWVSPQAEHAGSKDELNHCFPGKF